MQQAPVYPDLANFRNDIDYPYPPPHYFSNIPPLPASFPPAFGHSELLPKHTLFAPERVYTPVSTSLESLTSSPTIPSPACSPRSPFVGETNNHSRQAGFNEYSLDPLLKRRLSHETEETRPVFENQQPQTKRIRTHLVTEPLLPPAKSGTFSQLDMLSYISLRSNGDNSRFLQSDQTYTVFQPLPSDSIQQVLECVYGGRVVVSRKRKPLQMDFESHVTTPAKRTAKQTQGRPYSSEMVIDLIFPQTLDELYSFLCVKGSPPMAHRVKLQNQAKPGSTSVITGDGSQRPPMDKHGSPIFGNSQDMVRYFTGSSEFSIVTAFRQSSMDKSPFKKGTCPVVKFNISPVKDYSIEYLKRMAYPRYKACMKIYLVPQIFKEAHTFYTSGAMYLQDQEARLANGLEYDLKSRIFHMANYPDLPNSIYDKEFGNTGETKTDLNYILN